MQLLYDFFIVGLLALLQLLLQLLDIRQLALLNFNFDLLHLRSQVTRHLLLGLLLLEGCRFSSSTSPSRI